MGQAQGVPQRSAPVYYSRDFVAVYSDGQDDYLERGPTSSFQVEHIQTETHSDGFRSEVLAELVAEREMATRQAMMEMESRYRGLADGRGESCSTEATAVSNCYRTSKDPLECAGLAREFARCSRP
mmetsp:Transcript_42267/g.92217  ORF Transcript_42267/g.92217 Transcript_42267/m.92217 type:complete len:126 (+) Transcript_42267:33-410(+)